MSNSKSKRRQFLARSSAGLLLSPLGSPLKAATLAAPAIIQAESSWPQISNGIMSGDVSGQSAIFWCKTSLAAKPVLEWSTHPEFKTSQRQAGAISQYQRDFCCHIDVRGLPAGQTVYYRFHFEASEHRRSRATSATGQVKLPELGKAKRNLRFCFSGDEAGQGWGINPELGGYAIYRTMATFKPDFFIHSGDQIYADGPLQESVTLDDGSIWKNIVTPAKAKVAETLAEFRGNFAYNQLDAARREFAAQVPFLVQWDDHEVRNNWYPGQIIGAQEPRYQQQRHIDQLAAYAKQAMFEYSPMRAHAHDPERVYRQFHHGPLLDVFMLDERSYRGKNNPNLQTQQDADSVFLGSAQTRWLKQALLNSKATWKVIASDMPISVVVNDFNKDVPAGWMEAWANGDGGQPRGRELELAELLRFIKQHQIKNLVWVTADVHYAAATHFHPDRAAFKDFVPFWEFIGGPLNAGTFAPPGNDMSFGPEVKFCSVTADLKANRSPKDGLQFFGLAEIDAASQVMRVSLRNLAGDDLYSVDLQPEF